jgi:hypothetical protein
MLLKVKNKKGISIMIGYVLLVVSAIVISTIVYQWVKTYVPKESIECPEGVSLFISDVNYQLNEESLELTLNNNGRFNIAGYFIHVSNKSDSKNIATIDLSKYTSSGEGGVVFFGVQKNSFGPNDNPKTHSFDLSGSGIGEIYSVSIIPIRYQEEEGKKRFVSCGNAKIDEKIVTKEESPIVCGDGLCNGGETCATCPEDCPCDPGLIEIYYFGFEGSSQGWIDTGDDSDWSDVRSKVKNDKTEGGSYSFHLQDNSESSITYQNLDFEDYEEITIKWWGYYGSFEEGECVELKIDNVKVDEWGDVGCNNEVNENEWILHEVVLDKNDYTFDNSVEVKFEAEMSGDEDEFYLDGIEVIGRIE